MEVLCFIDFKTSPLFVARLYINDRGAQGRAPVS